MQCGVLLVHSMSTAVSSVHCLSFIFLPRLSSRFETCTRALDSSPERSVSGADRQACLALFRNVRCLTPNPSRHHSASHRTTPHGPAPIHARPHQMYMQSRNYMIRSYERMLEADGGGGGGGGRQAYLSATECRRKLAGDACSILR